MKILEDISLRKYNTFGIDASAKYFLEADSVSSVQTFLEDKKISTQPRLILGGGSNILFTKNFDGILTAAATVGRAVRTDRGRLRSVGGTRRAGQNRIADWSAWSAPCGHRSSPRRRGRRRRNAVGPHRQPSPVEGGPPSERTV